MSHPFHPHWRYLLLGLAAIALAILAGQTVAAADPVTRFDRIALQQVAAENHTPLANLRIVQRGEATYPLSNGSAYTFKILDHVTWATYSMALDGQGRPVDSADLDSAERAAYTQRYGRYEPTLLQALAAADSRQTLAVILWLREPAYRGPDRPEPGSSITIEQLTPFLQTVDAQRAAAVAHVVAPVLERLQLLYPAAAADAYSPVLYAQLTPAALAGVADWPEIDRIYLDRANQAELEISRPTVKADVVQGRGYTGAGVLIAQIEVGGRTATSNPYLSGLTQNTTYVCSSPSSHSTGVAGILRSTHSTRLGIAPGVALWAGGSCNGYSSELQNRSTAAADWGARALNLSWGSDTGLVPGADDRFYDDMVINRYRTVVKSAGNRNSPCASDGNVTSPGLAYNVITVGNFDDRNTTSWGDDSIEPCSSWRDPLSTHSDREKPEVAAPGTNINSTTTASPWTGGIGSGTSFSAPHVTAGAALLMSRDANLWVWPEAVKAILMATATHNIEGATRLSEYDGAGGVSLDLADDVARAAAGRWGGQGYACATAAELDVAALSLNNIYPARIAITWSTDDDYTGYTTQPSADLDLDILDASGNVVAYSKSWDNTYEIVEFTPPSSGTYTLRVHKMRCDDDPDWLGWAWYQRPYTPLSVSISGPGTRSRGQSGTWTASVSNGQSPFQYSWAYLIECPGLQAGIQIPTCNVWYSIGTNSPTLTAGWGYDAYIDLRVTVTDALGSSDVEYYVVRVGNPSPPPPPDPCSFGDVLVEPCS